jgi:hypothetical protein
LTDLSPGQWLGIALFAGYLFWLFAFFQWVRPRLMRALGRRLGTKVTESHSMADGGTWTTDDDAPIGKTGAVAAVDFVLLMIATVGVAAAVFIPAFLVAESGALLPLDNSLTGRAVALRLHKPDAMPASNPKVNLPIEVDNIGRTDLRACQAELKGYHARNGYMHGASPRFDIAKGARVAAIVKIEAMRPPPGEHRMQIRLDCSNERLAVEPVTVTVR